MIHRLARRIELCMKGRTETLLIARSGTGIRCGNDEVYSSPFISACLDNPFETNRWGTREGGPKKTNGVE